MLVGWLVGWLVSPTVTFNGVLGPHFWGNIHISYTVHPRPMVTMERY